MGQGNLDIPAILTAVGDVQLILEQEEVLTDPFGELAAGVRFFKALP